MRITILLDVGVIAGFAAFAYGLFAIYPPLAWIVTGLVVAIGCLYWSRVLAAKNAQHKRDVR